jgi:hypothetical protein
MKTQLVNEDLPFCKFHTRWQEIDCIFLWHGQQAPGRMNAEAMGSITICQTSQKQMSQDKMALHPPRIANFPHIIGRKQG